MLPVRDDHIGGAIVRRSIYRAGLAPLLAGHRLTREETLAIPTANRHAMVNREQLWLFPRVDREQGAESAERHIVHNGGGRFDVIAGVKLNDRPLSKDEAEDLATQPN